MTQPLDKLSLEIIKNGKRKNVPALAAGWAEKRMFIEYIPPPEPDVASNLTDCLDDLPAKQEAWLDRILMIEDDLNWLLSLSHHRFWSQVVHDEILHNCLTSFLTKAPRHFDPVNIYLTEEMNEHLQNLFRSVFLVFLRMGTFKESKDSCITPRKFGELIYDYFLFDIPKLLDLCILYQPGSMALLQKLVENIFKCQPKYNEDLVAMTSTMLEAFDNIEARLCLKDETAALKAIEDANKDSISASLNWAELSDIIYYLVDITATLSAFVEVYSPAAEVFYKHDFHLRIATFYESAIPILQTLLRKWSSNSEMKENAYNTANVLIYSKLDMLKITRSIIHQHCLFPVENTKDDQQTENLHHCVESHLEILTALMLEGRFIPDYHRKFPIENDIEFFHQHNVEVDTTHFQYILDTVYSLMGKTSNGLKTKPSLPISNSQGYTNDVATTVDYNALYGEGAVASPAVSDVELTSLISQVQDLLPDLGNGFIESCLEYYNYNVEKVIHAVLENELPNCLKDLDRNKKRSSNQRVDDLSTTSAEADDAAIASALEQTILSERRNVYDNDEFDVFNRNDVDKSRIFKGKRGLRGRPKDILNDKSHITSTRELYEKYSIIVEEVSADEDFYDDEYNDAYDDNIVGAMEPDRADSDMLEGRPLVTPRVLMKGEPKYERVESDNEEERSNFQEKEEKPRDCFVPNPEESRRKYEERRQMQHRSGPNPRNNPGSRDLKGKPKGQGQDEKVLNNRNIKEKHKSTRANHNRKNASDWKRSRGMFPT